MKNIVKIFISLLLFNSLPCFATQEIVRITPVCKVTTANDKYQEGDNVAFRVINSDEIVDGLIVKYEPNGFAGKVAILVIDNFRSRNNGQKYYGTISLTGNPHDQIMEFIGPENFVRGGEVTIKPNRDVFDLWRIVE